MSSRIEIEATGERGYTVTVYAGGAKTEHRVLVPASLLAKLDTVDEERLVRETFEFLLEREPAASVLGRFELDVIGRYFPEYEATMAERL